jgi:hypothetical protein
MTLVSLRRVKAYAGTDVSHGSTKESSAQLISIPKMFLLQRTMSLLPHGGIPERCDDSSKDQEEIATF